VSVETTERALEDPEEFEAAVAEVRLSVEALLFVASEALSIKTIAKLTHAQESVVGAALQQITQAQADRGVVVREIGGGYRFSTAPQAREAVEAYLLPPKTTLSTPALEALAIVAHMQPVTKGEIESIRGVNSDSVVNTLLDRNLIAEGGRKDVVGRPMQYKTTPTFLESFGVRSLDDLPQLELEPGQPLELDLLTAGMPQLLPEAPEAEEAEDAEASETSEAPPQEAE
jgi:segregation and condensation protein B